jgi:penicillin-binding protein 1C
MTIILSKWLKWIKEQKLGTSIVVLIIFLIWFAFCLPRPLFNDSYSTVLNDNEGKVLSARIASDGQWRFPASDSVPKKFEKCVIYFEDEYFYVHLGINPVSMFKALFTNVKAHKIVRGGSTISVQLIRLARKNRDRTIYEKFVECIMAVRLEAGKSKKSILNLYATHAPFGGNVVGLEAASWRYYGRSADKLSWGEMATLAVLPNAPSLIYPGRNHENLKKKRDRLLIKLRDKNVISPITCELSMLEPLPEKPFPLPQLAPHLLYRAIREGHEGKKLTSTIDRNLQVKCLQIIERNHRELVQNQIENAALIIIEIESGNVLSYIGNTNSNEEGSGGQVDIITSNRSSGSILKPFLYASMLKEGIILPNTLIPDIPTQIAGYTPENFDKNFDGAVHAGNALARSLNVPAIRMLHDYGLEKFYLKLNQLNFSTINKGADHYGLSIILGGAEIKLWDLVSAYSGLARILNHFIQNDGLYNPADYHESYYLPHNKRTKIQQLISTDILGAGSVWLTFEALTKMDRPIEGTNWELYSSKLKIAWKTGTSFGHRDAWAIGITPKYLVGIWVGNADGEGRPGLTGAGTAAPIMFETFKILPYSGWFQTPYDDLIKLPVCHKSGYKSSALCDEVDTIFVPKSGIKSMPCPFHQLIHLDKYGKFRVTGECYSVSDMLTKTWFVLPTVLEWYYKSKDPFYKVLPPFMEGCMDESENMDLIYPKVSAKIFIPRDFNNQKEKIVFEAAHRIALTKIFWHLDNQYLGCTSGIHKIDVYTAPGIHTITIVSEQGETKSRKFEVIAR